jgi:hypothetical protein
MEKSNISGFSTLTNVIRKLTDDITFDITPEIIAEPVATDDATYVAEVNASLTPEQQEKFGDNQKASAVTLIQNILKNVADTKTAVYMPHISAFSSFSSTHDEHAVLGRFKSFQSLFTEVRYHKMFDLKDGIKKLVAVVAPKAFLVSEIMVMWNSSPYFTEVTSCSETHWQSRNLLTEFFSLHISPHGVRLERCGLLYRVRTG